MKAGKKNPIAKAVLEIATKTEKNAAIAAMFKNLSIIKNPFFTVTAQAPCLLHALNIAQSLEK